MPGRRAEVSAAGSSQPGAIDTHHHFIPKAILADVQRYVQPGISARIDGDHLHVKDGRFDTQLNATAFMNIESNLGALRASGARAAVLSAGVIPMWLNLDGAKIYNREVAAIARRYPGTFIGLAHAPPFGEDGNCAELRRAVREDGLKGISIACTFRGVYPDDKAYWPFYETANELNVPIFVHAAACPVDAPILDQYNLGHSLGRGLDLTLVTVRVLYGGVLEDFPNVRFLMGHLGGMFYGMLDRLMADIPSRPENHIPARDYRAQLQRIWFDTAPSIWNGAPEIEHAIKLGVDRLCFGSDFPIGPPGTAIRRSLEALVSLGLPPADLQKILHDNAAALFKLDDVITPSRRRRAGSVLRDPRR